MLLVHFLIGQLGRMVEIIVVLFNRHDEELKMDETKTKRAGKPLGRLCLFALSMHGFRCELLASARDLHY